MYLCACAASNSFGAHGVIRIICLLFFLLKFSCFYLLFVSTQLIYGCPWSSSLFVSNAVTTVVHHNTAPDFLDEVTLLFNNTASCQSDNNNHHNSNIQDSLYGAVIRIMTKLLW